MPLSPDIERDLKALDEKMRKRAARHKWIVRDAIAVALLWVSFAVGMCTNMFPPNAPVNVVLGIVAVTFLFAGLGVGAWGVFLTLNYFMPLNDW